MGIYGWLIVALVVMFFLVILFALVSVGTAISPDEEAMILAEEAKERKRREAAKREKRGRGSGAG